MASISNYSYLITTVKGQTYRFGSLTSPATIDAAGDDAYAKQYTIATSTTVTLWDAAATSPQGLTDFDFMLVACDLDLYIELQTEATIRYNVLGLEGSGTAGNWGPPLILGRDDSLTDVNDMVTDLSNTGVLKKIRVHNADASNTAECVLVMFT